MPLKYGDLVQKVQKSRDGSLTRVNAVVLSSSVHGRVGIDRKPLADAEGNPLPPVEHIDLAFADPGLVQPGQALKTRNVDSIFRLAYDVAPYEDGMAIGYEATILPARLVTQLLAAPVLSAHATGSETIAGLTEDLNNALTLNTEANDLIEGLRGELAAAIEKQQDLQSQLEAAGPSNVMIEGTVGQDAPQSEPAAATEEQAPEASTEQ